MRISLPPSLSLSLSWALNSPSRGLKARPCALLSGKLIREKVVGIEVVDKWLFDVGDEFEIQFGSIEFRNTNFTFIKNNNINNRLV